MFASMIVALAIQQSGLHRRIALTFIKIFGIKPQFLMLGKLDVKKDYFPVIKTHLLKV